jgi:hypothetical protein
VDRIELPQGRDQWKAFVCIVMDLRFHIVGYLGRWASISFSAGDNSGHVLVLNCND